MSSRQKLLRRWAALKQERSSWDSHWQEIGQLLLPRSIRFLVSDRNKGDKRHQSIYDSTAGRALRTLGAGMMAGMTSPARPWFRLATSDPELMERDAVKQWLDDLTQLMRDIFARSNTYRSLHMLYRQTGGFGTGATFVDQDYDNVIHHYPMVTGEYALACDDRGRPNSCAREVEITVEQLVAQFVADKFNPRKLDWSKASAAVKTLWDHGNYSAYVPVLHVIEPRRERDYSKRDSKNLPFASCYIESGGNEDKYLRESGFKRFPVLAPRWEVEGNDVYGSNCPGMESLGDIKQLQHQQLRKGQAVDYKVKPPLQMPASLKNQQSQTLPGGVVYHDMTSPHSKIQSLYDVQLDLSHLLEDIHDVRERINSAFYADLFLFMQNFDAGRGQRQVTAREIAELHEEKLLMLGPVIERQHDELLSPKIDMTFDRIVEAGLLRGRLAPPPELKDVDLNIEFVSMLAQAQRAVGLASVDRFLGTVIAVGQTQAMAGQTPTVGDKVNGDKIVEKVGDMLGIDPDFVVGNDQVAIVRKQRDGQMRAAQAAVAAPEIAKAAKDASQADTEGKNLLTDVMSRFSGYGANA